MFAAVCWVCLHLGPQHLVIQQLIYEPNRPGSNQIGVQLQVGVSVNFCFPFLLLLSLRLPSSVNFSFVPFSSQSVPQSQLRSLGGRCKLNSPNDRGLCVKEPGRKRFSVYFEPRKRVWWQWFWLFLSNQNVGLNQDNHSVERSENFFFQNVMVFIKLPPYCSVCLLYWLSDR